MGVFQIGLSILKIGFPINLPETTGLTFPFKQTKNVSFSDGSLYVSDNGSTSGTTTFGIHEFDSDLSYVTGVSGSSQDFTDFGEFDWGILLFSRGNEEVNKQW